MKDNVILQTAAIVCHEVAKKQLPILYAKRSESENEADSGWQFLCGAIHENWSTAEVWSVGEVLEHDCSLVHLITLPVETVLSRVNTQSEWVVNDKKVRK